jgi:hypothetical protein
LPALDIEIEVHLDPAAQNVRIDRLEDIIHGSDLRGLRRVFFFLAATK